MASVILVGAQWGDEGKGKVVDALSADADLVVRFAGGANAGHTLVHAGQRLVLHLLPSGVTHADKRCLLGPGMVIDPEALLGELHECAALGLATAPTAIGISHQAHVILPHHRALDEARERGPRALGTTRRGIGPCYEDKMGRRGVQLWQLADREILRAGLEPGWEVARRLLDGTGVNLPSIAETLDRYLAFGASLARYLVDVSCEVDTAIRTGRHVLFEGAQGALLDVDFGTYPYVTSSSTIAGGACTGAGVGPTRIDSVIGVTKAYQTRVGAGPFPTELEGEAGERLRARGKEYGATTGRPRRCGWLDLCALRRAARVNGLDGLAVTKLDVLAGLPVLRLGTGYRLGDRLLDDLPPSATEASALEPLYEEMEGFEEIPAAARREGDLPEAARRYLARIEELVGVPVVLISVGPGRDETIVRKRIFAAS
jgi:adenylosuccinate synthase